MNAIVISYKLHISMILMSFRIEKQNMHVKYSHRCGYIISREKVKRGRKDGFYNNTHWKIRVFPT